MDDLCPYELFKIEAYPGAVVLCDNDLGDARNMGPT